MILVLIYLSHVVNKFFFDLQSVELRDETKTCLLSEKITREHKTALISLYSKVKKKTAPQDNVHIWDTCHNLLKKGGLDVYGYSHV